MKYSECCNVETTHWEYGICPECHDHACFVEGWECVRCGDIILETEPYEVTSECEPLCQGCAEKLACREESETEEPFDEYGKGDRLRDEARDNDLQVTNNNNNNKGEPNNE